MLPREHGAYGQLLFPMASALAVGRPGKAAFAWAAAAVFAFVAHEPLMVILGQRGAKAARDDRGQARRWLAAFLAGVVVFGSLAVLWMPLSARSATAVPLGLGALLALVIAARREHTVWGEVLSAIVMASLAWPAALAAGVPAVAARTCTAVFAGGFAAATLAVHAVIERTRRPPANRARLLAIVGVIVVFMLFAGGAATKALDWVGVAALTPMSVGAIVLAWAVPPARRLRTVGWTLVAVSTATAAMTIVGLRA